MRKVDFSSETSEKNMQICGKLEIDLWFFLTSNKKDYVFSTELSY